MNILQCDKKKYPTTFFIEFWFFYKMLSEICYATHAYFQVYLQLLNTGAAMSIPDQLLRFSICHENINVHFKQGCILYISIKLKKFSYISSHWYCRVDMQSITDLTVSFCDHETHMCENCFTQSCMGSSLKFNCRSAYVFCCFLFYKFNFLNAGKKHGKLFFSICRVGKKIATHNVT